MEPQVKVTQDVSDNLLATLRENDQQFATINPQEFRGALEKYLSDQWGSPRCRHFKDRNGQPSWVVDLSEALGGFVYYAVVSSSGGSRGVAGFVDEDNIAQVVGQGTEPRLEAPPQAQPQAETESETAFKEHHRQYAEAAEAKIDQLTNENQGLRNEIEALRSQVALLIQEPTDPVLVRYKKLKNDQYEWVPKLSTESDVGNVIADLLESGIKANDIEIWGRKSVPRVKIEW